MSDFLKCECQHCGQPIEYPADGTGQTISCPTCENPVTLTPASSPPNFEPIGTPPVPAPVPHPPQERKPVRTNLAKLTGETIRATTKAGDTPLHRAAKNGQFSEIPSRLLEIELFMAKNNAGETPLHVAAKHGHLDQVPREFLTKETLTISISPHHAPQGVYTTGSGYVARTETVLHIAVRCGYADQIPKKFLTPEFLSIEATGYRLTLLHYLAQDNRLDLVPDILLNSEMRSLKDYLGRTPRDLIEDAEQRQAYVAHARSEPATDKQREKLLFFGYSLKETMTKGEASDALDECVQRFPEKNAEYYNRPATEEQLQQLRTCLAQDGETPEDYADEGRPLTYGQAKDLLWECKMAERQLENEEIEKEIAHSKTEDGKIETAWEWINSFSDYTRDATWEEVAKAWALARSRNPNSVMLPEQHEVTAALEELYPVLLKPKRPGVLWHNYCLHCRGQIEVMVPPNRIGSPTRKDMVQTTVRCPHCERETGSMGLDFFMYSCPNCSKEWSIPKSNTGHSLHCRNCQHDFVATPFGQSSTGAALLAHSERGHGLPTEAQLRSIKESGFILDPNVSLSADQLEAFLNLEGLPPREEELELFRRHGITFQSGDAFAAYGLGVLIRYFEDMPGMENLGYVNISDACQAAARDTVYLKPTITLDKFDRVTFAWPKRKLQEWYRKGAES